MATTSTANTTHLESLPAWARELSEKYYSRTLAMFVLYGNVRDYVPLKREGATQFLSLPRFLNEALFPRRDLILSYDRGGGLTFAQPEAQADRGRIISALPQALQGHSRCPRDSRFQRLRYNRGKMSPMLQAVC